MSILSRARESRRPWHLRVLGTGALVLIAAASPAAAQEPAEELNARSERIASTYRLTEPVLRKYAAATRELLALARKDPSIVESADTNSVNPAVKAIFARAGLSEDELEKFSIAMGFAAMGSWAAEQSGEGAQAVKEYPPIVRANIAFLKTHEAAIKALEADMNALQLLQEGRKAGEAPNEPPTY